MNPTQSPTPGTEDQAKAIAEIREALMSVPNFGGIVRVDLDLSGTNHPAHYDAIARFMKACNVKNITALLAALDAALSAPPLKQWEPEFCCNSHAQEELALQFCAEIAGKRGEKGSPPDPVRLLEMAEALYKAERDAFRDEPNAPPLKQEAEAANETVPKEVADAVRLWLNPAGDSMKACAALLDAATNWLASQPPSSQGEPDMAKDAARVEREACLAAISGIEEPRYYGAECPNTFQDGVTAAADAIRARAIDSSMAAAKGEAP